MNFLRSRSFNIAFNVFSNRTIGCAQNNGCKKLVKDRNRLLFDAVFAASFGTSERRSLHPLLWVLVRPLAKFSAVVLGRGVRKWWQSLPKNRKGIILEALKRQKYKLALAGCVTGGAGVVYYQLHLQETPLTQRKRFIAFNSTQIQQMADFQIESLMEEIGHKVYQSDHPKYKRVETTARRLIQANNDLKEINGKQWIVTVIADLTENAFVLPNGHIFVYMGMLDLCENDDQLGVILGHEMAHAVLGHGAEQMSYTHLFELLTIVLVAAIWALLPTDFFSVLTHWFMNRVLQIGLHLPYSRDLETEADDIGLRLSAKACFDVRESVAFWKKLHLKEMDESGSENVEWLSTHPNHETRSVALAEKLPAALLLRQQCNCPTLPTRSKVKLVSK